MALYINTSQRPHHWPLKELRAEFTNDEDVARISMLQLDATELDRARTIYPMLIPSGLNVVVLYGDFASNVASALMYKASE